ncbi:pyruvate dehydrogenase [bacterium M21]|nr:pyruvate dehydrogenase [bacterium M21]
MKISKKILTDMYLKMMQTRYFEETAQRLFAQGKVHGTAHFCIGEEATGVGACLAIEKEDLIYATHRGHGQSIGKGMGINRMMAEFLGKETGFCKGKGGCMHIADLSVGNLGANGIVGAQLPIATGAALSMQMQKKDKVVVCFFGDGASNQGTFHEALNMASIWKLPVLFLCVNNQYGMSMHVDQHMNITDISKRAVGYGIKGQAIDGNDIFEVYKAVKSARKYVAKNGPMLLVANTYRVMGHSKSDANVYREKKVIEAWKKKCPIVRMRNELLDEKLFTEDELTAIQKQAEQDIKAAVEFANNSPEPKLENVMDDVYA